NQAVDKMRGPVNTKIKLTIMRKGQDKPVELTLTRDVIRVRSVRSNVDGDDVGFIRISAFNEQTTEGVRKAINDFAAQGGDKFKGYVIDLRNNPGGLLDQAISVSDAFQAKGIVPDIEVLQDVPDELKARTDTRGEASLRGHLKADGTEETGSQAYIPPDKANDKALQTALELIRGTQKNSAYPPSPKAAN